MRFSNHRSILAVVLGFASLSSLNALSAQHVTVTIKNMSCQACVRMVKGAVSSLPSVASADVTAGKAEVTGKDGQKLDATAIKSAIEKSGYVVENVSVTGN